MNEILKITGLPILTGLIFLLIPENREKIRFIKGLLALAVCLVSGVFSFVLYYSGNKLVALTDITPSLRLNFFGADLVDDISRFASFNLDDLSKLIIIFISLFALLLILYSLVRLNSEKISNFFDYFLITLGASYGAVFSNNLLLFVIFWGILAITLYKQIGRAHV